MTGQQTIAVFGASGLIGESLAADLLDYGFRVVPIARRFTAAQRGRFGKQALQADFMLFESGQLETLLVQNDVDVVVNCVGVLQDGPRGSTQDVHAGWTERLLGAMPADSLLIHFSVPGLAAHDRTAFSRTKREAETAIADSEADFVILRPGFVLAARAYGGSALLRAIASLPLGLSGNVASAEFKVTAIDDIAATVVAVARKWRLGQRGWRAVWDVMALEPSTAGEVVDGLARRLGGPSRRIRLPGWLMQMGAVAGDLVSQLGWTPSIRTTALTEIRRGVTGDPQPWMDATGIRPKSPMEAVQRLPVGVQERWFGRLYLLKPAVLGVLAVFWISSGTIALTIAFSAATAILMDAGLPKPAAELATIATSLLDIGIGVAIAIRRSARFGLWLGIAASGLYLAASLALAPHLWADPLGAMVKAVPAVVLMLVGLAILDDR